MKRVFRALAALILGISPGLAAELPFVDFIEGAPTAATPFGVGDLVPVVQGGVLKKTTTGDLINNSGMLPDASNATLPTARYELGPNNACNPVTDYAADPTGVTSATTAINSCAAVTKNGQRVNVYLPGGTYKLTQQINIAAGQCLYGDGRGITTFTIGADFDSAATSVINIAGTEQQGVCVHDVTFSFAQPPDQTSRANFATLAAGCTTAAGGTGCKYPPAIGGTAPNRFRIYNVRVGGAWDGFVITGNTGGAWFDNIEMGALNQGLNLDGALDFVHVKGWHSWPFGFDLAGTTYTTVYRDGSTTAMQLGNIQSFQAEDIGAFRGNVNITSASFFGQIVNLALDSNSKLNITGANWLQIANLYATQAAAETVCQIANSAGKLLISNIFSSAGTAPAICHSGGTTIVTGGQIVQNGTINNQSAVTVSGSSGIAEIRGVRFSVGGYNNGTTPVIDVTQTGTGAVHLSDIQFSAAPGAGGPALSIATDVSTNYVANNNFMRAPVTIGFTTTSGYYDIDYPFALTQTPAFATPGDSVLTVTAQAGAYFRRGSFIDFIHSVSFDTNAYATASGNFKIDTNMPLPIVTNAAQYGCGVSNMGKVTYGSIPGCAVTQGASTAMIQYLTVTSGAAAAFFGTTQVPASTTGITFRGSGRFRVR